MSKAEPCNDPNCSLTREGVQHTHNTLEGNVDKIEIEPGEYFLGLNPKLNILYIANNRADSIQVIDGTSKKEIKRIEIERPRQLVVSADNNSLYAISGNAGFKLRDNGAKISIIDTNSHQIIKTIGEKEGFGDIKLNEDTNLLYATQTNSKKVWIIDTLTNAVNEKIDVGAKYRSMAIDSTNNKIYLAGREGLWNKVSFAIMDGTNNDVEKIKGKTPWQSKKIWDLYFNPNNKKLYALIEEPTGDDQIGVYIQAIDIDSKSYGKRRGGRNEQDRMEFDVSRNRIYFSKTLNGELSILDDSLEEIGLFKYKETPSFSKKYLKGLIWPTKIKINPEFDLIYIAEGSSKTLYFMKIEDLK